MKNHDIENLIEDALSAKPATGAFKENLLQASMDTIVRQKVFHRRLRTAGFTLFVLFLAGTAFLCGRYSVPGDALDRQALTRDVDEQDESVMVSKDLVDWLEAARFFKQLGMEERVTLSYRQASKLIPYDVPTQHQAGLDSQSILANIAHEGDNEIFGKIIAQNFGGLKQ